MHLKLLTPAKVIVDQPVKKVIAEATHGSFCLLPQHIDFLAVLVPGLLTYVDEVGHEHFAAVGVGVLVKQGEHVLVSSPQATVGGELEQLQAMVRETFAQQDEGQRAAQTASAKLEASFLRSYMDLVEQRS